MKLGTGAEPPGGAKFIAGPDGSGTATGGTGGGRSLNIWAAAGVAMAAIRPKANASTAGRHLVRPGRQIPLPPEVMNMLFTENAANSSLTRPEHRVVASMAAQLVRAVAIQSQCPASLLSCEVAAGSRQKSASVLSDQSHEQPSPATLARGINHPCATFWRSRSIANSLAPRR
jgi:hypothetical protein